MRRKPSSDSSGKYLTQFGSSQIDIATGIAAAAEGNAYASDLHNARVLKFGDSKVGLWTPDSQPYLILAITVVAIIICEVIMMKRGPLRTESRPAKLRRDRLLYKTTSHPIHASQEIR